MTRLENRCAHCRWPRALHAPRQSQSTHLFGLSVRATSRRTGAALVLPACNTEVMQFHLDEIATKVAPTWTPFSSSIKPDGVAPKTASSNNSLLPRPSAAT